VESETFQNKRKEEDGGNVFKKQVLMLEKKEVGEKHLSYFKATSLFYRID